MAKLISDEEQIAHYRGLSLAALANAHEATSDDHRTAYLEIAGSWASIAEEAARWVGGQAIRYLATAATAITPGRFPRILCSHCVKPSERARHNRCPDFSALVRR